MASTKLTSFVLAIPVGIPAGDVLKQATLKKVGMMLNLSSIKNWTDVADKLGKSIIEIDGHYSRLTAVGDPAYSVLTDWMINSQGTISQLCQVFEELDLISCLDEVKKDVEDYLAKSETKQPTENNVQSACATCRSAPSEGSMLSENSNVQSSMDDNSPEFLPCSPLGSTEEHSLQWPSATSEENSSLLECSVGDSAYDSGNHMTSELESLSESTENVDGKVVTEQTDSCTDALDCAGIPSKSQTEASSSLTTSLENDGEKESAVIDSQPSSCPPLYHTMSCPEQIQRPCSPLSPPRKSSMRKCLKKLMPKRSVSLEESKKGKKPGLFSRKHSKKHKKTNKKTEQSVNSELKLNSEMKTYPEITVADVHVQAAEEKVIDFSPIRTAETGDVYSGASSSSDENQNTGPVSHHRKESGYSSDETELDLPMVDTSKRIFILCHNGSRENAEEVYEFFNRKGCDCHFDAMDVHVMAEQGPYSYIVNHMRKASFVLICLSPGLNEVFEGLHTAMIDDEARALFCASNLMMGDMGSHCKNPKGKYMPLLFSREAKACVPYFLQPTFKYYWPHDKKTMISVINGKPQVSPSKVNTVKYAPKSKQVPSYKG